jgi:transcriptional regulator with XRE-family HTH domain
MEEQVSSLGPIMKAARKFKKLNQSEVASAIGCSQSALSKMEHNQLVPSAHQWFKFSRFTAIPPEALERGVIDRHSVIKFNNQDISLGFKIPKRYRTARSLKVREIYPFLHSLELFSPLSYKNFLQRVGLDLEFFLDFDNLVNFLFLEDVLKYFVEIDKTSEEDLNFIIEQGQDKEYWGEFLGKIPELKTPLKAMEAFCDFQPYYQMDFFIKVEGTEEEMTLSYFPEFHLNQLKISLTQSEIAFLNRYRKKTIENFLSMIFHRNFKVTLLEEVHASILAARFSLRA